MYLIKRSLIILCNSHMLLDEIHIEKIKLLLSHVNARNYIYDG